MCTQTQPRTQDQWIAEVIHGFSQRFDNFTIFENKFVFPHVEVRVADASKFCLNIHNTCSGKLELDSHNICDTHDKLLKETVVELCYTLV